MKETLKNFLSLLFATLVWVAGFLLPLSLLFAAVELDIWYLIPALVATVVLLIGLWFAKRSHRFMAALEYPFGFFSGGPHY
jgi:hypothetical protein